MKRVCSGFLVSLAAGALALVGATGCLAGDELDEGSSAITDSSVWEGAGGEVIEALCAESLGRCWAEVRDADGALVTTMESQYRANESSDAYVRMVNHVTGEERYYLYSQLNAGTGIDHRVDTAAMMRGKAFRAALDFGQLSWMDMKASGQYLSYSGWQDEDGAWQCEHDGSCHEEASGHCGAGCNGCTLSPDGSWHRACDAHDQCYGDCGKSRSECDDNFYYDVREQSGSETIARIYYTGVRLFGWMFRDQSHCETVALEPG